MKCHLNYGGNNFSVNVLYTVLLLEHGITYFRPEQDSNPDLFDDGAVPGYFRPFFHHCSNGIT